MLVTSFARRARALGDLSRACPLVLGLAVVSFAIDGSACGGNSGGTDATGGSSTGGRAGSTGGVSGTGGSSTGGVTATGGQGTGGDSATGGTSGATGGTTTTGGATAGHAGGASGGATAATGGGPSGGNHQGGAAGGTAATGGQGGKTTCAGNALSLSTNGFRTGTSGANNDAAAARVDVDFGSSTDLPTGNGLRTIEYWAYVPAQSWTGNANTMFFYGSTARPAHGFGLDFGTDGVANMSGNHATLDPYTNGGYDADSTTYLGITSSTDQWVHFAMTWDGKAVRTFVNGKEYITKMGDSGSTMLNTDKSAIAIGGYEQDGNYFNGSIDEFRVWNVARTAAEITSTMNKTLAGNETGLVLYLKFDETSGTSAADAVSTTGHTAHNGVLKSANSMPPTFVKSTAPINCP